MNKELSLQLSLKMRDCIPDDATNEDVIIACLTLIVSICTDAPDDVKHSIYQSISTTLLNLDTYDKERNEES
jgi:hypothetical protein